MNKAEITIKMTVLCENVEDAEIAARTLVSHGRAGSTDHRNVSTADVAIKYIQEKTLKDV